MLRPPPISTRAATLVPDTTLFLSCLATAGGCGNRRFDQRPASRFMGKSLAEYLPEMATAGLSVVQAQHMACHVFERDSRRQLPFDIRRNCAQQRTEEHTSELPSLMRQSYLVFFLTNNKIYTT